MKHPFSPEQQRPSALSFDWDGVLVDSVGPKLAQNHAIAHHFGNDFTPDQVRQIWTRSDSFDDMLLGLAPGIPLEEVRGYLDDTYDLPDYAKRRFPYDVFPTVQRLRDFGYRTIITSNLTDGLLRRDAEKLGVDLANLFDHIHIGDADKPRKPDPAVFSRALGYLGVAPYEMLHVDDELAGLTAAKGAGVRFAGVASGITPYTAFRQRGEFCAPTATHFLQSALLAEPFDHNLNNAFRETEPTPLWSRTITCDLSPSEFRERIVRCAQAINQGFTGFTTMNENGRVTSYTRTLYPRKKYKTPTVEECEAGFEILTQALGGEVQTSSPTQGVRVVMGLYKGYSEEIIPGAMEKIQSQFPKGNVRSAEVFTVRLEDDGSTSTYEEPAAAILANATDIQTVCTLANDLDQERFALENFDTQQASMIETPHCTGPDYDTPTQQWRYY